MIKKSFWLKLILSLSLSLDIEHRQPDVGNLTEKWQHFFAFALHESFLEVEILYGKPVLVLIKSFLVKG